MKSLINIGSKRSNKNLNKLAIFIKEVFKAGKKYERGKEEVIAALKLGVEAFSSSNNTISGCSVIHDTSGKKK